MATGGTKGRKEKSNWQESSFKLGTALFEDIYREASSWMNVKEQMLEIDVTDVEDNAESSWMLQ